MASSVSLYADYYFEYSPQRQVTKETIQSGSQTFEFAYLNSTFTDDYNHWKTRTTETLPDGNQNIIYSNYAGQTMLKVFQSGGEQWCEFTKFDDNGRAILFANPSAVNGYDDAFADLLDYDSGSNTYLYLNDHAGLIRAVTYVRWTTFQYTDCCLTASQRVYHKIPSTGTGSSGTNFDATDFGYSVMKRRNRTVTPGGTITDIVYDPRGLVLATYVGTNGG